MNKLFSAFLLVAIVAIAFVVRIYHVSSIPPSLSWDEVSIGYNAYSILKTGKDEHGKFMPLDVFVAYGDYKPPVAVYLTIPFVYFFGLNELSVRLPSVLFGTLTVFMTYLLVVELFRKRSSVLAFLSAFLLAVSPWHINISRAGFEANIALFFIILGVYFVLKAEKNYRYWLWAWIPFVAAIYTFNSARYFSPMFGLVLCLFARKHIVLHWKTFMLGILVAGILLVPITPHLLSKEARLRFAEVNIFTDSGIVETANNRLKVDENSVWGKIFDNRRVGYTLSYLRHFADNLQPSFLFIKGDGNPKFSIQETGQLYAVEAFFLFVGLLSLSSQYPAISALLLFWLLLAIVPAATARETPHALRILDSLPTWQIFIAYGIVSIYQYIANWKIPLINSRFFYYALLIVLYSFSMSYYLHNYYSHYAKAYSGEWQYGYREAIRYADSVKDNYDVLYLSEAIGRPYMYTLFYTQYNPVDYWRTRDESFDAAGFYHVYGFGKYRFIDSMPADKGKKALYMVNSGWVPQGARVLKTIQALDGYTQLVIFDL